MFSIYLKIWLIIDLGLFFCLALSTLLGFRESIWRLPLYLLGVLAYYQAPMRLQPGQLALCCPMSYKVNPLGPLELCSEPALLSSHQTTITRRFGGHGSEKESCISRDRRYNGILQPCHIAIVRGYVMVWHPLCHVLR